MSAPACVLEARELTKSYFRGSEEVRAVDGVSLRIEPGEFVSLVGASGSGKTTLLNLIGCLDNPTSGEVDLDGRTVVRGGNPLSVEVPSVGGRRPRVLTRQTLCEIIQPRLEEVIAMVDREVRRAGYAGRVNGGAVVTGGSSIMEGVPELAEQILDMPVRRGVPRGVGGLTDVISNPMYATGVGLGVYGAAHRTRRKFKKVTDRNIFDKVIARMKEWFGEIF